MLSFLFLCPGGKPFEKIEAVGCLPNSRKRLTEEELCSLLKLCHGRNIPKSKLLADFHKLYVSIRPFQVKWLYLVVDTWSPFSLARGSRAFILHVRVYPQVCTAGWHRMLTKKVLAASEGEEGSAGCFSERYIRVYACLSVLVHASTEPSLLSIHVPLHPSSRAQRNLHTLPRRLPVHVWLDSGSAEA